MDQVTPTYINLKRRGNTNFKLQQEKKYKHRKARRKQKTLSTYGKNSYKTDTDDKNLYYNFNNINSLTV